MPSPQEFTELLQGNLLPLNRLVLRMVGNPFDADDIVQETVLKAFIHFSDLRVETKFKTWLMSIAVNEVRTRRRAEYRSRMSYFDFDELEQVATTSLDDSAFSQYQKTQTAQLVQNATAALRPAYREMIRLRTIDGLDFAEMARRLSISIPASKARYYLKTRQRSSQALIGRLERRSYFHSFFL